MEEQIEFQKKQQERLKLEAERKIKEMQDLLQIQIRNEVDQKMKEREEQYKKEKQELNRKIATMETAQRDLQYSMLQNEQIRKIQQHQILHLKGNMRVFCRVKPVLEDSNASQGVIKFPQLLVGAQRQQAQKNDI